MPITTVKNVQWTKEHLELARKDIEQALRMIEAGVDFEKTEYVNNGVFNDLVNSFITRSLEACIVQARWNTFYADRGPPEKD